jgi:hypothetical protein
VSFEKVAVLGNSTDPIPLATLFSLARDSRGRYYALSADRSSVLVFEPDGKFATSFGRSGQGPGEFSGNGARLVRIGAGDTVHVVDSRAMVLLYSPSYKFIRQFSLGASPMQYHALRSGGAVMSASHSSPAHVGLPFHFVAGDSIVRSIGPEQRSGATRVPALSFDLNVAAKSIMRSDGYSLHSWAVGGVDLGVLNVVGAPWLPAQPAMPMVVHLKLPATSVRNLPPSVINDLPAVTTVRLMGADTSGLIWFSGKVVSSDGRNPPKVSYLAEVIDPRTKQVLVSKPAPAMMEILPGTNLAFSGSVDGDGFYITTVWRFEFRQ